MLSPVTTLLLALWATAVTALQLQSVAHSGKACPQGARVSWSGPANDELVFTFHGLAESLAPGTTTACQVHVQIDEGVPGKSLRLDEVTVRGGLQLGANTRAEFYSVAFWSETAVDTETKETSISSGASSLSRNVAVSHAFSQASSPCVAKDGYVGILNVNFRLVAQGSGQVSFGRERGWSGAPASEVLKLSWESC